MQEKEQKTQTTPQNYKLVAVIFILFLEVHFEVLSKIRLEYLWSEVFFISRNDLEKLEKKAYRVAESQGELQE